VDDDADIRETLQIVLELQGHQVMLAANGKHALAELAREPLPCLILLDLMMPEMNGWEFMTAQRADPRLAHIPVVVLSGDGSLDELATENQLECLEKPVDVTTLVEMVKRFCPH
jgi:CheY-like chemotaxis protein